VFIHWSSAKNFPSMAVSWLIRLVFLTINVLMAVVLVISNSDFCASVYKTQTGKLTPVALLNGLLTPFPRRKENTFLKSLDFSRIFYDIFKILAILINLRWRFRTKSILKSISFSPLYLMLKLLTTFITYF